MAMLWVSRVTSTSNRRFEEILPGNPKPGDYKIVHVGPFNLQQRCAPSFRVGRILLAADAAHLCNPLYAHTFLS